MAAQKVAAVLVAVSLFSTTSTSSAYGSRLPWFHPLSTGSSLGRWDDSGESGESGEYVSPSYQQRRPSFSSFYPSFQGYNNHRAYSTYSIQTPSFTYNFDRHFNVPSAPVTTTYLHQNYKPINPSFPSTSSSSFIPAAGRPSIFSWLNPQQQQYPSSSRTNDGDDGSSEEVIADGVDNVGRSCFTDLDCDARRFEVCDANYGRCRVCFPRHFCGKRRGGNCGSDFHCSAEPGLICRLSTCICRDDLFDTVDGCVDVTALSSPQPAEGEEAPSTKNLTTAAASSTTTTSTPAAGSTSSTPSGIDVRVQDKENEGPTFTTPSSETMTTKTTTSVNVDSTPLPPAVTSTADADGTTAAAELTTTITTPTQSTSSAAAGTETIRTSTAVEGMDETTVKSTATVDDRRAATEMTTLFVLAESTTYVDEREAEASTPASNDDEKASTVPASTAKNDAPDAEVVPATTEQQPEIFGAADDDEFPLATNSPDVPVIIPGDEITQEPSTVTMAADGDVRESSTPGGTDVEEKTTMMSDTASMNDTDKDTDRGVNFVDLSQIDLRDGSAESTSEVATGGDESQQEPKEQMTTTTTTLPTMVMVDSSDFLTRNASDVDEFGFGSPDDASVNEV